MNIKIQNLRKIEKEGSRFLGVATIIINDVLVVEDIKIIQAPDHKFIAMPSKKVEDKIFDIAFPINPEARQEITKAVLDAYDNKIFESGNIEEMNITDIKVNYTSNASGPVAVVSVVFNDSFIIKDLMLVKELSPDGNSSYRFFIPTRVDGEGMRRNIYYPQTKEFADKLFQSVFNKYKEGLN